MKFAIFTQTEDIVNWDNILRVMIAEGTYGDTSAYALLAQPLGTVVNDEGDVVEGELIQLGMFINEEKCREVYSLLKKHLSRGVDNIFEVPADTSEE